MDRNHVENGEAVELEERLAAGEGLPVLDPGWLVVGEDEVLRAEGTAGCWWFGAMEVSTGGGGFFAFGRPLMFAATGATSWLVGRARRARAERQAAPQWRWLGVAPVRLTSERMLLGLDGEWASMWLHELIQVVPDEIGARLWLTPEGAAPFVLEGPWVPYLTVALQHLLHSEPEATVPEPAPPAPVGYCTPRGA